MKNMAEWKETTMNNLPALKAQFPLIEDLIALKETTWLNPRTTTLAEGLPYVGLTEDLSLIHI